MIKITAETFVRNLVYNTTRKWREAYPERKLEDYDEWKEDLVASIIREHNEALKEENNNESSKTDCK